MRSDASLSVFRVPLRAVVVGSISRLYCAWGICPQLQSCRYSVSRIEVFLDEIQLYSLPYYFVCHLKVYPILMQNLGRHVEELKKSQSSPLDGLSEHLARESIRQQVFEALEAWVSRRDLLGWRHTLTYSS